MIENLLAWMAQVFLLVTVAAAAALALRDARARLYFWQGILVVVLLLPAAALWQQPTPRASIPSLIPQPAALTGAIAPLQPLPVSFIGEYLFGLLATGAALRLVWLTVGLLRLRGIRRRAVTLHSPPVAFTSQVGWYLSDSISGPVTYGWPRASILLPARFREMSATVQEAIASHELMHVHRGDWLFVMGEEMIRGLLWFHPAVWFVLSRIQLAREQVVDREVVRATNDRTGYLDALMAVAAQKLQPDIAPAPLFLKKRQLAVRVAAILKETSMSSSRLLARVAAAASAAVLGVAAAVWLFPFQMAAQIIPDDAGITVDAGAPLLHRPPLRSPGASVAGDVIVEATLNTKGEVTDAHVLSGPEEARRAVLANVLDWHYSSTTVSPKLVRIAVHFNSGNAAQFVPPPPPPPPPPPGAGGRGGPIGQIVANENSLPVRVNAITFPGLTPDLVTQIENQISVHAGDTLDAYRLGYVQGALNRIDEHLSLRMYIVRQPGAERAVNLSISLQPSVAIAAVGGPLIPAPPYSGPTPISIGTDVAGKMLVSKVNPSYPDLAKKTRIQGAVTYQVIIGTDGTVQDLQLTSGNPMLATPEVADAVRQWRYQPYLLNGQPVPVQTEIVVNFVLN